MSGLSVLVTVGVACTAALAVVAFMRWVLPAVRKMVHLVDDLAGQPARPGVPAQPGVMERLATIETQQRADLTVRARLDRIESTLTQLDDGQKAIIGRQDKQDHDIQRVAAQLAKFHPDTDPPPHPALP